MDWESSAPSARRAFADVVIVGSLLLGWLTRLRIHFASPLPSDEPISWFALAIAGDVAVFGLAGAGVFAFFRRGRNEVTFRWIFSFVSFALALLSLLWSEALVYFAHPPRAKDLEIAARASFFRYSAEPGSGLRLAICLLLFGGILAVALRRARHAEAGWSSPGRLALLGLGGLGICLLPVRVHLAESARHPLLLLPSLLGEIRPATTAGAAGQAQSAEFPDASVRQLAGTLPGRVYLSDRFPLAHAAPARSISAPRLLDDVTPNIVFVLLEGVRANEVGVYAQRDLRLTPRLDRIAREGIRVARAYSPGTNTPEGELALWYGLLAVAPGPVLTRQPQVALTGLPEILRAAGWRSFLWIHNSDQTFYGEDRFFGPRGFRTIDGRDFSRSDPRTSWGYSDRALARRAVMALDRLEEPFAAMMLTISNHHPFTLPPDAGPTVDVPLPEERGFFQLPGWNLIVGRQTARMMKTVHYTDEALGDFFDLSHERSWYGRTLFVIASDHGLPLAPAHGVPTLHEFTELRHRVPLIFFSPLLAGGGVVEGPASLADVPATLLGLLRIPSARSGVGDDLLDPETRDPDRPVVSWNDEARLLTVRTERRVYHARFPAGSLSASPEEELLIDPAADPQGRHDLSDTDPEDLVWLRRAARIYLEVYSRIVVEGRSGLPVRAVEKEKADR